MVVVGVGDGVVVGVVGIIVVFLENFAEGCVGVMGFMEKDFLASKIDGFFFYGFREAKARGGIFGGDGGDCSICDSLQVVRVVCVAVVSDRLDTDGAIIVVDPEKGD